MADETAVQLQHLIQQHAELASSVPPSNLQAFLSQCFLDARYTLTVARIFKSWMPVIMATIVDACTIATPQENLDHVTFALSKVLPMYPQEAFKAVCAHLKRGAPLLDRLLTQSKTQNRENCLELIKAAFRLLRAAPHEFSKWNWAPFFTLVQHKDEEIKWYAVTCVSILLEFDELFGKTLQDKVKLERQMIETEHVHLQQKLAFFNNVGNNDVAVTPSKVEPKHPVQSVTQVCGIWLPCKANKTEIAKQPSPLVYTKTTTENMRSLALAVSQNRPILLEGITGSGKTALVEEVAKLTNNHDLIKVNLDESFDSKDLLGTYVCTDVPGEFKWQPGALTRAVLEGRWILIEDIDLAPFDIISTLIPLVESNNLFIPSRDELIPAAPGFQLFSTQSLIETFTGAAGRQRAVPMANLWYKVTVDKLPSDEIKHVFNEKYPALKPMIPKFIETYETLRRTAVPTATNEEEAAAKVEKEHQDFAQLRNFGRFFSFRDLLKFGQRVEQFHAKKIKGEFISMQIKEDIFHDAIDCFCGMIVKRNVFEAVIRKIAQVWQLDIDRVDHFLSSYKPKVTETTGSISIGRVTLPKEQSIAQETKSKQRFAHTKQSLQLLEQIAVSVQMIEPVLLTGETGTGKTSIVAHLASLMGRKLVVHNLNQQTDSADFIGGFKPVDAKVLALGILNHFEKLFPLTFSVKSNGEFLSKVKEHFEKRNWKGFGTLVAAVIEKAKDMCAPKEKTTKEDFDDRVPSEEKTPTKQRKIDNQAKLLKHWTLLEEAAIKFNKQQQQVKNSFAFSFAEGSLVKALKEGHWILLDEINLASTETLERLSGLLEGAQGTLFITEKGDTEPVKRHANFRLFACMNPPTDIGKKNLPPALRNRFTEFYVNELLDKDDLKIVVTQYLQRFMAHPPVEAIVTFYLEARKLSEVSLNDGANQRPHYSLRTLARSLEYVGTMLPLYGLDRSLYESFCMGFLTQLSRASYPMMEGLIKKCFLANKNVSILSQIVSKPGEEFVQFEHFWLKAGPFKQETPSHFILTASVKEHLKNLARIVMAGKYPILLQGPTSAGKTSMVNYLAKRTGHRFVRINNHESTDVQEYLGSYITNSEGKLVFKEGILVEAVRNGYWIVLDELNLAPSDILEALNRLLDDNRELFIPETQETIKPHPHFQLFATQNPPGAYGGRKMLSRAFRNRFQELHIDDIPGPELETILQQRCGIPSSYAKKLVAVMKDLQVHRQSSKIFAGKHGFITPRDLFRWAERNPSTNAELAQIGYCLLAERLRRDDEKLIVKQTLEKHMKVELNIDALYSCDTLPEFKHAVEAMNSPDFHFAKIIWTKTMKRLFFLVGECLKNKEPILLVGETGCGKTTICQLYSHIWKRQLHILNCHQHTEPSDFLGSLRPVRGRDQLTAKLKKLIQDFVAEVNTYDNAAMTTKFVNIDLENITAAMRAIDACMQTQDDNSDNVEMKDANRTLDDLYAIIQKMHAEWKALFVWYDGPLVQSMKQGDMFLIDEISLAEDAVLERLNSVLEPDRTLVLAEKGSEIIEEIVGHDNFRVMATMNPGGDFGKRELSPALRNRFTEIYVPSLSVKEDLAIIIADRLHVDLKHEYSNKMVHFVDYFKEQKTKRILSIRDLISWVDFCNMGYTKLHMSPNEAFLHGAEAVILEGVGIGIDTSEKARTSLRKLCVNFLLHQTPEKERLVLAAKFAVEKHASVERVSPYLVQNMFGFAPFYVLRGKHPIPTALQYSLDAPTTRRNVTKVLRAMQLPKPLLLEGSPGVGKTSLIQAIAKAGGHNIVRINLSEQTDIMDLLGTDLPVEGSTGGEFQWSDGIFLRALKAGDWVLLDELNLASQSVLEGLNSVLDHRAEIFIPELNKTFQCPPTFRIFACQNPLQQGGGRKGLPKSFLNRFTQIYVEEFTSDDLLFIAMAMHGDIGEEKLRKMIAFNEQMHQKTMVEFKFGRKGSPWEFNLRDVFRWCELLKSDNKFGDKFFEYQPQKYIDLVYRQRMRTEEDKDCVSKLFEQVFGTPYVFTKYPSYTLAPTFVQVGSSVLNRNAIPKNHESMNNLHMLHCFLNPLESVLKCIEMNYMCILTGVAAAGKTSLVRLVAQLTGNVMHEFSMSSSTDTVELLGGFEQVDPLQKRKKIASAIKNHIDYVAKVALHNHASKENVAKIQQLYNSWSAFCSKEKLVKSEYNSSSNDEHEYLNMMEHLIEEVDVLCKSIDILFEQKDMLLEQIKRVDKLVKDGVKGRFEWNDGVLIKSLEAGHWILIDNVNFCNPTVLDRLNSLLEPGGVLVVNERGLVDGDIKIVKPHPNFRIFMCMNPTFGEVSRAMRNRGIEICLSGFPIPSQDALALLSGIGVPSSLLNNALMNFHSQYVAKIHNEHEKPTIRDLIRCADIICAEVREGTNVLKAISEALDKVYIRGRCTLELHRQTAIALLHQVLQSVHDIHAEAKFPSAYVLENTFLTTDTDFRTLLREGAFIYDTIKLLVQTRTNKKSADKSSLEHLEYALKYFVDMDAPATSAMRKLWLERMLKEAHSANDVVALIQQSLYILEKRRTSSVFASILAARSKLPSALATTMQYQPIDSRLNASYHELIKYQTSIPASDQDLLDKLAIVSERLPHIYQEMSYLAAMKHGDVLPSNSSLVMQSYYFYLNPQRAAQAATDIIPKLYYLFQGIEQVLDAITSADADRSLSVHAKELVVHRDRLWHYCFKHQQLASEYLVYWNWLLKSMKHYEHMKQVQPFNNVFLFIADLNQITNKFFDNMGRKNNLWKNSGKPKLSDAQHVAPLREQLSQSANKLETVFDKEAREVLLKGLCTLEWMVATNDASQELQKSISEIPAKLDTMIAIPKQADLSAKQNQEQELDAIFHEVAEIDISNRNAAAHAVNWKVHSAEALVSLFDHTSAQAEQEVIGILVQLAYAIKQNAPFEEQKKLLNTAVTKAQKLINLVLLKCSRVVTDMIPYQTLCWKFGSPTSIKPADVITNVPWIMHDMVTRWTARLWKNSFNEMAENNVLAKVGGPARLYQDIRSFKVASLLREWHLVPIRARYAKIEQMKHVVEFLAIHGVSSVVQEDVDWSYAFYTFANSLICFERSLSGTHFANILQFLGNLQNRTNLQESSFELFRAALVESNDERLKNCSSTAFNIAVLLHQSADKTQFLLRGKMWSLLGVFLLELIIPGQPIDPALKYSLSLAHLQPQIAKINDQLIVYRQIEGFITGSPSNLFIEQLQAEKVHVEESIKKLEKKVVKRPANVLFRELYREMKQFIATMIDKNKLQSLIDMLSQHAAKENPQQAEIDSIMVKEDVWQHNAYQFVNKLSQRYPGYDDIIMPFVTCVYYVKYGLRLQTHSTILTSVSKSSRFYKLLGDITRTLLRYPSPNSITSLKVQAELVHEMLNEPNTMIFSKYDKYEAALKILKVLLSKIHLHVTHSQEVSKESVQLLDAVFAIYSRVWAEVKDELEAKKKEDENLYKFKEKTTVIENDDQIVDKEISKMFPSFADEYAQFNVQQQGPAAVDEKLPMSSAEKVFAIAESHEELKYMIGVQRDVFGMNVSQKENLRTYIFDDSFQAASHLMTRLHSLEDTSSHYLSLLMYASKSLEQLSERINSRKIKLHNVYDSYNEPNVAEMTVAFNVVHDLVVRMRQLLLKYEEHPTLIQIIQIAEHILNKPVTSPVMKILTGIEILLKKSIEWEEFITSTAGTVKPQIEKLTSLIIRWRRMELENWRCVFDNKAKQMEVKSQHLWFQLYRIICLSTYTVDSNVTTKFNPISGQFFAICDEIIRSSTFGEFKVRITLLDTFCSQIGKEMSVPDFVRDNMTVEVREKFRNILYNMKRYYGQFVEKLDRMVAEEVKPLESKLNDFLKLVKWEDVNYESLKSSALKSQRKLAQFSSDYGIILAKAARELWDNHTIAIQTDEAAASVKDKKKTKKKSKQQQEQQNFDAVLVSDMKKLASSFSLAATAATDEKLGAIEKTMHRIIEKHIIAGHVAQECNTIVPYLEEIAEEVIVQAQQLREKEALKTVKKRALLSLLSELKELGISHRSKTLEDVLNSQNVFEQAPLEFSSSSPALQETWQKADAYYYKNLHLTQKLKLAMLDINPDINKSEVTRMKGYSDNLLAIMLLHRSAFAKFAQHETALKNMLAMFNGIAKATGVAVHQDESKKSIHKLKRFVDEFSELIEQHSILLISLQKNLKLVSSLDHVSKSIAAIQTAKTIVDGAYFESLRSLLTIEQVQSVISACNSLKQANTLFVQVLNTEYAPKSSELDELIQRGALICDEVIAVLNRTKVESTTITTTTSAHTEEMLAVVDAIVLKVQLSVQHLKEENDVLGKEKDEVEAKAREEAQREKEQEKDKPEEPSADLSTFYNKENGVARLKLHYETVFKAVNIRSITEKMQELIKFAHGIADNANIKMDEKAFLFNALIAKLGSLLPIIQHLFNTLQVYKLPFLSFHKSIAKLDYILLNTFITLLKEGFCEKQEGDGEGQEGETQFSHGTGMDDGEGEENVEDQLENEDQLLNQKDSKPQQKKKDKKDDDDEEDNAIEMDQDFAADMEDMDKQDNESDEEPEEENMDKDMGEIDDDDPNKETLDKKLWDEEQDEEDREEKNDGNNNSHDQEQAEMQAKDQDDDDSNEKDNKKQEQRNKPKQQAPPESMPQQDEEEVQQEEYEDKVAPMQEDDEQPQDQKQQEEQEFQLPADLDLNDDMGDEEEEQDEQDGEDQGEEDANERAPKPEQQQQQQNDDEQVDTDALEQDDQNVAEEDQDEEKDDSMAGLESAGQEKDPMQQDDEEQQDDEDQQNDDDDDKTNNKMDDQDAFEELKETPFGVNQTAGQASEIKNNDQGTDDAKEKEINTGEDKGSDVNKQDVGQSWEDKKSEQAQQKEAQKQFDPNPYRNLGDAIKKWKEKLKMIEQKKEQAEKAKNEGDAEEKDAEAYEFMKEDEEDPNEQQTLASATEEQSSAFPQIDMNKDEEEEEHPEEDKSKGWEDEQGDDKDEEDDSKDQKGKSSQPKNVSKFDKPAMDDAMDVDEDDEEADDASKPATNTQASSEDLLTDSTIHTRDSTTLNQEEADEEELIKKPDLTMDDIKKMRDEMDTNLADWRVSTDANNQSKDKWKEYEMMTSSLSQELCEQLRLILEPTLATKLKGDYKTGKRINMKKVIPYIASQYRKDKIWLRRTKPNKRQYQVLVSIDDSMSMANNNAGHMACAAVALLCKALAQLEVGQLSVISFGEKINLLHPFDKPFTDEAGSDILGQFTFNQKQTQMATFMDQAVQILDAYRSMELATSTEQMQICFIISDGRILDRDVILRKVREAHDKKQLFVFILIDNPNPKESVLEMKSVSYDHQKKMNITSYMDQFPFPYYIILRDIQQLPGILADALRQWFELMNMLSAEH